MIHTIKGLVKLAIPRRLGIWKLPRAAGRSVLLTFDDGPHPATTPAVLDRLKEHGARAIFFVVGNRIGRAPEMLHRILEEGHILGNHSYTHPLDRGMGLSEYRQDLRLCEEEIYRLTHTRPRFHRPPLGSFSLATVIAPIQSGLTTLFWSCTSEDWRLNSSVEAQVRAIDLAREIRPCDILLFHDETPHTVTALDHLLPRLRSQGFNLSPDVKCVR